MEEQRQMHLNTTIGWEKPWWVELHNSSRFPLCSTLFCQWWVTIYIYLFIYEYINYIWIVAERIVTIFSHILNHTLQLHQNKSSACCHTHTHTDFLTFPPQCSNSLLFSKLTNDMAIVHLSANHSFYCDANQPITVPYVHPNWPISWQYPLQF